eukprot:Phypoly_transcript_00036.p1 GENE.Phypoly_transcript_00036~~Phypoly_transcript_00036.p1  ORF type:complete len:2902 (+),score=637.83 Phypoly_transcript_00036:86-8791(+)
MVQEKRAKKQVQGGQKRRRVGMEEYKNKALYEREDGTTRFKFKGFAERIADVNIDVFHRTGHTESVGDISEDSERTYFNEAALRWRDLNLSQPFMDYLREVLPFTGTLAQLLFHRNKVIDITLKHLKLQDPLAIRSILDLLATLARDLRAQAFPNFSEILTYLVEEILDPLSPQSVEDVFTCICLMFKYLQRQLVRDFDNLFKSYASMFGHGKQYIRQFAAESLSFLYRKIEMEKLPETVAAILESTKEHPTENYCNGVALLFFNAIKGTQGQYHSRAMEEFPVLMRALDYNDESSASVDEQRIEHTKQFEVISNMSRMIITHTKKSEQSVALFWKVLDEETKRLEAEWSDSANGNYKSHLGDQLGQMMLLVKDWAMKILIKDTTLVCSILRRTINPAFLLDPTTPDLAVQRAFNAFLAIQELLSKSNTPTFISFIEILAQFKLNTAYMLDLFRSLDRSHLSGALSELFIKYIDSVEDITSVLDLVVYVCTIGEQVQVLPLPTPNLVSAIFQLLQKFGKDLGQHQVSDYPKVSLAIDALCCIQVSQEESAKHLLQLIDLFPAQAVSGANDSEKVILGKALSSLARLYADSPAPSSYASKVLNLVKACPTSVHLLEGATAILRVSPIADWASAPQPEPPSKKRRVAPAPQGPASATTKGNELPAGKQPSQVLLEFLPLLAPNAAHRSSSLRKATLGFLTNFAPPPACHSQMETFFQTLLDIENTPLVGTQAAHIVVKVNNLENMIDTLKVAKQYNPFLANFLLGAYYIKYSELWPAVQRALSTLLHNDFNSVWPALLTKLTTTEEETVEETEEPNEEEQEGNGEDKAEEDKEGDEEDEEEEEDVAPSKKKASRERVTVVYDRKPQSTIFKPKDREWTKVDAEKLFNECLGKETGEGDASTDIATYGKSLWSFLGGVATTVESHSNDIITIFLDYIRQTMPALLVKLEDENKGEEEVQKKTLTYGATLFTFMNIFAKFRKPAKMHQATTVYNIFDRLLSNNNQQTQKLALQCVLTWRDPAIVPYKTQLENLLDKKYGDELPRFGYEGEGAVIAKDHRKKVVEIVAKLFWPKLTMIKERQKAGIIMEWFASLELEEIQPLMDFLYAPFSSVIDLELDSLLNKGNVSIKGQYQVNFLTASEHVLDRLPDTLVEPHVPTLLKIILYLVHLNIGDSKDIRVRRTMAFERLAQILGNYPDYDFGPFIPVFTTIVRKCLTYVTTGISKGVLSLFRVLALVPALSSLLKEPELMPKLIELLRRTGTHQIEIVEMLEDIMEVSESNPSMRDLISPHVSHILEVLPYFRAGKAGTKSLRNKGVQHYYKLIASLSEYTTNPDDAAKLLNIISPVLYRSKRQENVLLALLTVAANQIPHVANPEAVYAQYMRQFALLTSPIGREAMMSVLEAFAKRIPELDVVVALVQNLNSVGNARIGALKDFTEKYVDEWSAVQLRPILHIFMFIVRTPTNKDTAFTHGVLEALARFDARVARECSKAPATEKGENEFFALLNDAVIFTCYFAVIGPHLRIRQNFMTIVGDIIVRVPQALPELKCLVTKKINFFKDCHDSKERTRKDAFHLFLEVVDTLSLESIETLFLPFLEQTLLTANFTEQAVVDSVVQCIGKCTKNMPWSSYTNYIKVLMHRFNRYKAQAHELVSALCAVVDNFHFAHVLPASKEIVMPKKKQRQRFVIDDKIDANSATAEVATEFSASRYDALMEEEQTMEEKVMEEYEGKEKGKGEAENTETKEEEEERKREEEEEAESLEMAEAEGNLGAIREKSRKEGERMPSQKELNTEIIENLLPILLKHVSVEKKEGASSVRVFVAMAVVRLLRFLPQKEFDENLPGLIAKICGVLASKAQDERSAARKTVVQIARDLGSNYLLYILTELNNILKSGHERHVYGEVLYAIVAELASSMKPGEIDHCFPIISAYIMSELFGPVAHEKQKKMFNSYAEARGSHAFQTLTIICSKIDFKQTIGHVIKLVHEAIVSKRRLDMADLLSKMMNSIRVGILDNASVELPDLLVFIFNLIREYILTDRTVKPAAKQKTRPHKVTLAEALTIQAEPKRNHDMAQDQTTAWLHMIGEMAMKILNQILRKNRGKLSSVGMAPMVDPYVSLLLDAMESKFTSASIYAVKAFVIIIEMKNVPSVAVMIDRIVTKVFSLLLKSQDAKLTRHCFEFAMVLTSRVTSYTISTPQLLALVSIVSEDIHDSSKQEAAFEMLKALLSKKLMCPEIYDLMVEISKMLVRTHSVVLRDHCVSNFVTFLIHFPLGKKRLDQHIHFLIQNLNYSIESGRIAVLEVFVSILAQFPLEIIEEYSQLIFIPLVARLASDVSSVVRKKTDEVIKMLVEKVGTDTCTILFNMAQSWFETPIISKEAHIALQRGEGENANGAINEEGEEEEEGEGEKAEEGEEEEEGEGEKEEEGEGEKEEEGEGEKEEEGEGEKEEEREEDAEGKQEGQEPEEGVEGEHGDGWQTVGQDGEITEGGQEVSKEEMAAKKKEEALERRWVKDRELQIAGSQLMGIFAEAQAAYLEKHISPVLPTYKAILDVAALTVGETSRDGLKHVTAEKTWGNVYAALRSLERVFTAIPDLLLHNQLQSIWYGIFKIMTHPHAWVKLSVARLLGFYFSKRNLEKAITKLQEPTQSSDDLFSATNIVYLFSNSVLLLRSAGLTAKMGEQLIKNIVFLVPAFVQCPSLQVPPELIAKKGREEGEGEGEENGEEKAPGAPMLLWMFRTLVRMSYKPSTIKITCIFHLLGALTTKIRSKQLRPYLLDVARFISRFEDNATFVQVKREVKKAVIDAVGGATYAQAEHDAKTEQREYDFQKKTDKKRTRQEQEAQQEMHDEFLGVEKKEPEPKKKRQRKPLPLKVIQRMHSDGKGSKIPKTGAIKKRWGKQTQPKFKKLKVKRKK